VQSPVDATFRVTSPYGQREITMGDGTKLKDFHIGMDFGNGRLGDPVRSVEAGTVMAEGWVGSPWSMASPPDKLSTWGPVWGGIQVLIDHGTVISHYAHLNASVVNVGQKVPAGFVVGSVGQTGSAYRAGHLHLNIFCRTCRDLGQGHYGYLDPAPLIAGGSHSHGDDMAVTTTGLKHVTNKRTTLTTAANFRVDASTSAAIHKLFDAGTAFHPTIVVQGDDVGGRTDWYGGWMFTNAWRFGFFHGSVLGPMEPIERIGGDTSSFTALQKQAVDALRNIGLRATADADALAAKKP
jgi:hypothetical protein